MGGGGGWCNGYRCGGGMNGMQSYGDECRGECGGECVDAITVEYWNIHDVTILVEVSWLCNDCRV